MADVMTGGLGSDTFVFKARDASADGTNFWVDTITDFTVGSGGDILDISDLLVGYNGNSADYVRLSAISGGSMLSVDPDGAGASYVFRDVTALVGVTGQSVSSLLTTGNLDVVA